MELKIIDTPLFQRLRNIKQLSLGHYVYHGAEHSRFGHALGAMHLAGLAFDALENNTKNLGQSFDANETDRQTIRIAALLHDVGHPPFSHSLENLLGTEHEEYSKALVEHYFAYLIDGSGVDIPTVLNLISGDPYPGKPFLSKIISGQLDVDRLDYLLRDSYYAGVWYGQFDLDRIISQLCVYEKKFVVKQGGYESIEQLIFARQNMYQQVYFHKTKRAFELMLWKCGDILKKNNLLEYPSVDELSKKEIQEKFANYNDLWYLNKIYDESNPEEVRSIAKMIKLRKPYLETYSPLSYRSKTRTVKTRPEDYTHALEAIQTNLLKKLPELDIKEHEFLTDELSRAPYKLMPDYLIADETEEESDSIQIFYKNRKLVEPIEKRSDVVYSMAVHRPFMMRGFVIPEKYEIIRRYLRDNFEYPLPERSE